MSTTTDRKIDQPKVGDQVRLVIEGEWKYNDGYRFSGGGFSDDEVVSLEVLEPPKPEWVQGDVVVINPGRDFSFVLVHQADRWVCSKENARTPHDHTDDDVNSYLDNGRATVLIAGGKVVTPE